MSTVPSKLLSRVFYTPFFRRAGVELVAIVCWGDACCRFGRSERCSAFRAVKHYGLGRGGRSSASTPTIKRNASVAVVLAAASAAALSVQLIIMGLAEAAGVLRPPLRLRAMLQWPMTMKSSFSQGTSFFAILTSAHRMRVHFCPQHWLLCHLGLY